jgi:hypothetical protein
MLLIAGGSSICSAATNELAMETPLDCVVSTPKSNIVVVFKSDETGGRIFSAEKPIIFGFASLTNTGLSIFMLRPEYGYRIAAKNESGKTIEKTRLGARYGARFEEVKAPYKDALDMTRAVGYLAGEPYWTIAAQDVPSLTRHFPAPQDLFKIDEPGVYNITVELQCLCSDNLYLVRLPPVELKVLKIEQPVAVADHSYVLYMAEIGAVIIGISWLILRRGRGGAIN